MSSLVAHLDANKMLAQEKMDTLCSYMQMRDFPKPLFQRVRKYYKRYYKEKTALDEVAILGELSVHLREEVAHNLPDRHGSSLG